MNKLDRVAYWAQEIAFACPLSGKRHSINHCFGRCEFSGTVYHDNCAWVKCGVDAHGEREVHDGKPTRDN